jgi:hypothetical protein
MHHVSTTLRNESNKIWKKSANFINEMAKFNVFTKQRWKEGKKGARKMQMKKERKNKRNKKNLYHTN